MATTMNTSNAMDVVMHNKAMSFQFPATAKVTDKPSRKWTYLLSDNLMFSSADIKAIHLKKPDDSQVYDWLVRIVKGGQCNSIYVEQLNLDPVQQANLTRLCSSHDVSIYAASLQTQWPKELH